MTSDEARLAQYVTAWRSAVDDTVALLRDLDEEDWARPTDLPGWDVRAVAAHLAHLESELAGNEQEHVEVPELEHIASPMGIYTEMGPLARAGWATDRIIEELASAAATRSAELEAAPPTDPAADPPVTPGGIGWNTETLLSNRAVDVWMHEQDIRRAVGRPGSMDGPGAVHTVGVFARSFGYVVGKRVGPPAGTTVVLDVTGVHPVHLVAAVGDDGRGHLVTEEPAAPTVTLRMDLETYVILSGGRRTPDDVTVEVTGDQELGGRVLAAMPVTP
ncbi:MAG: maleylpyruvate isomerase family mycothiol-dependent enzyme [Nocardioidaceae bacterium]